MFYNEFSTKSAKILRISVLNDLPSGSDEMRALEAQPFRELSQISSGIKPPNPQQERNERVQTHAPLHKHLSQRFFIYISSFSRSPGNSTMDRGNRESLPNVETNIGARRLATRTNSPAAISRIFATGI